MILFNKNKETDERDEKRFFVVIYVFILLFGLYSGMYCYRFGVVTDAKHHIQAANHDFETYFKYLFSKSDPSFETVEINFKFSDYMALSNQRSRFVYSKPHFFNGKQWLRRNTFYAKATLKYKGEKYKVKAKLFGKNNDHFRHPYKWSFRVKAKDYIKEFNNGKFNLLQPNTRLFITDVLSNKVLKTHNILSLEYLPVQLKINDRPEDIYFVEDFFSKYLIERNGFRDSYIFTFDDIKHPSVDKLIESQLSDIEEIKEDIVNNPRVIIDEDKFDKVLALLFLAQNTHPLLVDNFHMFYNGVSNRVEPVLREVWFKHAIHLKSKKDLEEKLKTYITSARSANTFLSSYFTDILNNPERSSKVLNDVLIISEDIKKIRLTEEWKLFENTIYSRYPQAVYLCKNININTNAVHNLQLEKQPVVSIEKELKVLSSDTTLESDLILSNTDLQLAPGITLDLNGHHIILNSGSLIAISDALDRIQITNTSKIQSSIVVNGSKAKNELKNVDISKLSNFDKNYWHLPAGITFYESNVLMENVTFKSNTSGDDFVNLFRCSEFFIKNVSFSDVNADAIDSDFSTGIIENCSFVDIGNDAIDGSGSEITINNSFFDSVEDKVISAGENSTMNIYNSIISNSEIAFVSKDDSKLKEHNNTLNNNRLNYCLFNKKKEFDDGTLYTDKDISESSYLIEKGSKIYKGDEELLNLKVVDSVKESLYGIEYGKKSK